MFLPIIFIVSCLQFAQAQSSRGVVSTTTPNRTLANVEFTRFLQVDSVGSVVTLIDAFLSQISRGLPPPKSSSCNTQLIQVGRSEIKFSRQPRGRCSYCCRLINPSKYIKLYFTSQSNNGNTVELKMKKNQGLLRAAGVNSRLPTVMYIHGFIEYGNGSSARAIRDAYLSLAQDYNIIVVDWGELSAFPWYPQAVYNSRLVGAALAKFIQFYDNSGELPIENLHLVGFSIGAHISGFIGKKFQDQRKIPRITALDPALPLYPIHDASQILSKSDAKFVDVIHTNAGAFGAPISLGHADFYPNAQHFIQPGCDGGHLAYDEHLAEQYLWCSHRRAWKFYAESVRDRTAFPATKCGVVHESSLKPCEFVTDGYMGFLASKSTTSGDFYLTTNDRKPFGKSAKDQRADMKTY